MTQETAARQASPLAGSALGCIPGYISTYLYQAAPRGAGEARFSGLRHINMFIYARNGALIAAALLLALHPALAAEVQPEAAAAGTVVLRSDVMVPMRDGIQLAADIYLPAQEGKAGNGRFPALDRKSTRLNSSHLKLSRMPSSA